VYTELSETPNNPGLNSIKAVYRNLRENYEYYMRYDETGEFFLRELELRRKYSTKNRSNNEVKKNHFFIRHFSLTGLYYHLSRYGEDLRRQ
jgi:cell division protein YceG involved in septum cleavage